MFSSFRRFIIVCCVVFVIILLKLSSLDHGSNLHHERSGIAEDFLEDNRLFNLENFHFILEPKICSNPRDSYLGVILVTSYAGHDDVRAAHRQGISQLELQKLGLVRIFLLAEIPENERFMTQASIASEQRRFGDLLQGSFKENYRNLTYKHVMGLRWATHKCAHATTFIIKVDDDSVYDVYRVHSYLKERKNSLKDEKLLAGYVFDRQKPIRLEADKHYVSPEEYPGEVFPKYLSGWLYITNPHTIRLLLKQIPHKKFFWIDDTYVTGILAEDLSIEFTDLSEWFSANPDFMDCCVRDLKRFNLQCEFVVGPNGGDTKLLPLFQNEAKKCFTSEKLCKSRKGAGENLRNTCVTEYKDVLRKSHGSAIIRPIKL